MSALKRIQKEYKDFLKAPVPNTTLEFDNENNFFCKAKMKGPPGSKFSITHFIIMAIFAVSKNVVIFYTINGHLL